MSSDPKMVDVLTAQLGGRALDWALAGADGITRFAMHHNWPGNATVNTTRFEQRIVICDLLGRLSMERGGWSGAWEPSKSYGQGGPLLEKYGADVVRCPNGTIDATWKADLPGDDGVTVEATGGSPLEALCRAVVLARLGPVVQIPEELL